MLKIDSKDALFEYFKGVNDDILVVVKYGASWCNPCTKIQSTLDKCIKMCEDTNTNIKFVHLDYDDCEEFFDEREISSLPTVELWLSGVCIDKIEGFKPDEVEKQITSRISLDLNMGDGDGEVDEDF